MTHPKHTVVRLGAVALAVAAVAWPAAAQQDDMQSALEDALRSPVESGDIPMAVGAITTADETTFEAAFGTRSVDGEDAVSMDSVFYIASMTKPIVSAAAMQLVEDGTIDLDSPISTWLPDAADLQVLDGFDDSGEPVLRAPEREMTLRDLMTHSAGTAYTLWDADLVRYGETVGGLPPLDYDDPATWQQPLMFDPGTRWEYGIAIDWIGRLVQEVSGQSLGAYLDEHIFTPLGMDDTSYELSAGMGERRVDNHQRQEDGSLQVIEFTGQSEPVREYGGGGLYSTVPDYMRFIRMILNDGTGNDNQVLEPETVEMMSQNQMGDLRVEMLYTTDETRSLDAEFFPGLAKSWGMSFMINEEEAPTGRPAGSLAWAGLYNTFFWIDVENEVGGVFMSQLLPFVDEEVLQAFYDFEAAYYDASDF